MNSIFKKIYNNRVPIFASAISFFVIWRFNKNFTEYARAASKEKVYDVRRATEQLNLYRELYNPDKDVMDKQNNKNIDKLDKSDKLDIKSELKDSSGPNKLLSMASEEDKIKLKEIFNEYDNMEDADELKKQISKVKKQIELLEERKTSHQGIKLSRVMYGYEPSEEALKKIREHYKDNKQKENK
jgi:hypothetical protein